MSPASSTAREGARKPRNVFRDGCIVGALGAAAVVAAGTAYASYTSSRAPPSAAPLSHAEAEALLLSELSAIARAGPGPFFASMGARLLEALQAAAAHPQWRDAHRVAAPLTRCLALEPLAKDDAESNALRRQVRHLPATLGRLVSPGALPRRAAPAPALDATLAAEVAAGGGQVLTDLAAAAAGLSAEQLRRAVAEAAALGCVAAVSGRGFRLLEQAEAWEAGLQEMLVTGGPLAAVGSASALALQAREADRSLPPLTADRLRTALLAVRVGSAFAP
ncbi:hypothetical protein HYH03_009131 [Edaphochlamys debaryana]|uniref:Uncharacterized protein n=1 Tax=Edaphochlamys debaryana TaxID=47281 RepID=A0A836BYV6_9CHLO|nr:hypothetical protein HYH03_009131 [Edaphochlamys debaryana]|eukprot:KAG2492718.1 hypothetical protein HYH03_009131 [Edaphochlamys debaryana]